MNRETVGKYLEYYRIKNDISIQSFLYANNHEICSTPTYKKVMSGECKVDAIYLELVRYHQISFSEESFIAHYASILDKLAYHIEYRQEEKVIEILSVVIKQKKITSFPCICFADFFSIMHNFLCNNKKILLSEFNQFKPLLSIFSTSFQVCFYSIYYRNNYRFSNDITTLESILNDIPITLQKNTLFRFWNCNQLQYNKKNKEAIDLCEKLIIDLEKTHNKNLLIYAYQSLHGNYKHINNTQKAEAYFHKLQKAQNDDTIDPIIKESVRYYCAMHFFNEYKFNEALAAIKTILENNATKNAFLILPYCHLLSFHHINNYNIEYLNIMKNVNSRKLFAQYYEMKKNNVAPHKLKMFLCDRLQPICNQNNVFDYHIILGELLLLDYQEEFKQYYLKCKSSNYVILKDWKKAFQKNCNLL